MTKNSEHKCSTQSKCPTQERILDSAEKLFASKGYEGTSMRMITSEAGANLAAVNYHFGSKEDLARALFRHRLTPINEIRSQLLKEIRDSAEKSGKKPDIDIVLRGLLVTTIEYVTSGGAARTLPILVGRSMMEPTGVLRSAFIECVSPLIDEIVDTLQLALPNLSREKIWMRFHFATGAMGKAVIEYGVNKGKGWNFDIDFTMREVIDEVIRFTSAGMEAE